MTQEFEQYSHSANGTVYDIVLQRRETAFGTHQWSATNTKTGIGGGGWVDSIESARKEAQAFIECGGSFDLFPPYATDDSRFDDHYLDLPLQDGIVFKRDDVGVHTNVRHYVVHHSPRGFEWGYGGSGPADLALNLLQGVLIHTGHYGDLSGELWDKRQCYALALHLYQDFKWRYIAALPSAPGTYRLGFNEVQQWIQKQSKSNGHEPTNLASQTSASELAARALRNFADGYAAWQSRVQENDESYTVNDWYRDYVDPDFAAEIYKQAADAFAALKAASLLPDNTTGAAVAHADEITIRLLKAEARDAEMDSALASTHAEMVKAKAALAALTGDPEIYNNQRAMDALIAAGGDKPLFMDALRDAVPEPDYDAYLAEQQRQHEAHVDAIEEEWEVKKFIGDNGYHPDEHYPGRSRENDNE